MSEADYEKAEEKLVRKFEEKLIEIKEQQKTDRNDFNNKLGSLKVDMSQKVFSKEIHNFLRDKVYPGWSKTLASTTTLEQKNEEFEENIARMKTKVN